MSEQAGSPPRVASGDDVLDWLRTADARAVAARLVTSRRLPGGDATVDDALASAAVSMLQRMRSSTPLDVRSPGGYGRAVLVSVVRLISQGRDLPLDGFGEFAELDVELVDPLAGDEVRMVFEQRPAEPWLASAALAYLVYLMFPGVVPDHAPAPKAGATPDQARCWPALWFAGERDLFPDDDGDPNRRTRARRIEKVLARVELAFARLRLARGDHDG